MEDEWREGSEPHGLIGLGLFQELGLFLYTSFLCMEPPVVAIIGQGKPITKKKMQFLAQIILKNHPGFQYIYKNRLNPLT